MGFPHRIAAWALTPIVGWWSRHVTTDDAWNELTSRLPTRVFPIAPRRDFAWYLGGESRVAVVSVSDICEWLAGCEYVRDRELFVMRDFWQHPRTFEQIRKGDCEDHALWAWRKLLELGLDARFFIGEWGSESRGRHGGHAWVGFAADGEDWILEPTRRDAKRMVIPMAHARADYLPFLSVDGALRRQTYVGYLLYLKRRYRRGRTRRARAP